MKNGNAGSHNITYGIDKDIVDRRSSTRVIGIDGTTVHAQCGLVSTAPQQIMSLRTSGLQEGVISSRQLCARSSKCALCDGMIFGLEREPDGVVEGSGHEVGSVDQPSVSSDGDVPHRTVSTGLGERSES